ncbi:unnamed protein product [Paramecium sonneborni]|uniref:TFIIS central domain-containing protein n=1 Tax=Paramecium sonneborni TaxID=65129 RepID=A0A8S1M1Y8_9CILI|nr:unnamed protein product [Paramecium sonneborni]
MSERYNLADFVKFKKGNGFGFGKIENFSREEDWFQYFEYILSQDLPTGKQQHHGQYEVFKTDQFFKGRMSEIIEKVKLMKLSEYIQMNERKGYVIRQQYISRELMPPLKYCFCNQYVNPDQVLVVCNLCEKAFHAECLNKKLNQGLVNCDSCREQFTNKSIPDSIRESLKIKKSDVIVQNQSNKINEQQNAVLIEEEGEEEIERNERRIDLDKILKKIKIKEGQQANQVKIIKEQIQKDTTIAKVNTNQQLKQTSQPFKNISTASIEKIKLWVEKYKQMESNVSSFEKKRQEVREKFFTVIFYGIEELRDLFQQDQNSVSQQEKWILSMTDVALFQYIKNLALDIEVFTHIKYNVQFKGKLEPNYIDRCKLIYLHMKDDNNLELRRKVISKEFQAQDLCIRDERDLYNPDKRKETQEIAMRVIEMNQKEKEDEATITKEMEEVSLIKQQSIIDEFQSLEVRKDGYSSQWQLKEKLIEYSVENSLSRFKTRIAEELSEREKILILNSLDQFYKNQ